MKIAKDILIHTLARVSSASCRQRLGDMADGHPDTTLYNSAYVEAAGGKLSVTVFDGMSIARAMMGMECDGNLNFVADMVTLQRLSALRGRVLDVDVVADKLVVTDGASRLSLATHPLNGFPYKGDFIGSEPAACGFKIDGDRLASMVAGVRYAIAPPSEHRDNLTGVNLRVAGNTFHVTATTGSFLASYWAVCSPASVAMSTTITPAGAQAIDCLRKGGEVEVGFDHNAIWFRGQSAWLSTSTVKLRYPEVLKRFWPLAETESLAMLDTSLFLWAVRRLAVKRCQFISVKFGTGEATLRNIEEGLISLPCEFYGLAVERAFSPAMLLSLRHIKTERFSLQFCGRWGTPVMVRDTGNYWGLIMPMCQSDNSPEDRPGAFRDCPATQTASSAASGRWDMSSARCCEPQALVPSSSGTMTA